MASKHELDELPGTRLELLVGGTATIKKGLGSDAAIQAWLERRVTQGQATRAGLEDLHCALDADA